MARLTPLTPLDVRDRLICLLEGNGLIADNFENPIKKRDPGSAPPAANPLDLNTGVTLCSPCRVWASETTRWARTGSVQT